MVQTRTAGDTTAVISLKPLQKQLSKDIALVIKQLMRREMKIKITQSYADAVNTADIFTLKEFLCDLIQ